MSVDYSLNCGKLGMGYLSIYAEFVGDLGIRVGIELCHTGLRASSEPGPTSAKSPFPRHRQAVTQGNLT
jgi:hypothetical protein